MDIAWALDRLVPGGDWQGSVTEDFIQRAYNGDYELAYGAIRWVDERTKPPWVAVVAIWEQIKDEPEPHTMRQELDDLKARITQLERGG